MRRRLGADMCMGSPFSVSVQGLGRAGTVKLPCRGRRQEGEDGLEEEGEKETEDRLGTR